LGALRENSLRINPFYAGTFDTLSLFIYLIFN